MTNMAHNVFDLWFLLTIFAVLITGIAANSGTQDSKQIAVCFLPKVKGLCMGIFPRFYFDKKQQKCVKFIYGGCGGNQNNFVTEKECKYKCTPKGASGQSVLPTKSTNKTTVKVTMPSMKVTVTQRPCLVARANAINNKINEYSFVPECDLNGEFLDKQCWKPSRNQQRTCWCVDKTGSKIGEVYTSPNGAYTCKKPPRTKRDETECSNLVKLYHNNIPADQLPSIYVPQCDSYTGLFTPRQCHKNTCWCVDIHHGNLVKNSFGPKASVSCKNN